MISNTIFLILSSVFKNVRTAKIWHKLISDYISKISTHLFFVHIFNINAILLILHTFLFSSKIILII